MITVLNLLMSIVFAAIFQTLFLKLEITATITLVNQLFLGGQHNPFPGGQYNPFLPGHFNPFLGGQHERFFQPKDKFITSRIFEYRSYVRQRFYNRS